MDAAADLVEVPVKQIMAAILEPRVNQGAKSTCGSLGRGPPRTEAWLPVIAAGRIEQGQFHEGKRPTVYRVTV